VLEAQLLLWQGRNPESLALLGDALPSNLSSTDLGIKWAMVGATAYARMGQMTRSDGLLRQAQTLCEEQHSKLAGDLLRTRGVIDVERNDLTHANEMFRQSLQIARQQDDKFLLASALLNLGVIALQQERFDETLDWSREAAQVARVIDARVIEEKSQGNVAYASYALGNFEDALNRFREAQQEAEKLGSPNDEVEWLNDAGLSLYRLGDYREAESCYTKALRIAESIQYQGEIIETHVALASLYVQQGKPDAALQHTNAAFSLAHSAGRSFDEMDIQFLKGIIATRQNEMSEASQTLTDLEKNPAIRPSLRWQVQGALANLNAETNNSALADKWYQQSITTFETQRATIKKEESKLPFAANADKLYDDYVRFLVNHSKANEALQWLDLGRARTLEEGLGVASPDFKAAIKRPFDAPAIARRLHGTVLVYTLAPQESYLWAVNSSGTHFFKLPRQEEIDKHVKNYQRAILGSRDPLSDAYTDGMALYRILVEPAASLIPKDSPVYIIPDGSISTLNFETLLAPGGGIHYWIEDATITNASSLKLLAAFHPEKRERNRKQLLLIGNPVSPDEKFPDLPNASAEVTNVAKHFPAEGESVFVKKQALPSAYTNGNPGEYSLIHFVAHGTSSSASPLDSAIVLTRNPANPDSFKLYARDVIAHPLHADLVAISACYGSGSRVYGGDGLVGLSWAFLRAGSHYVIGSLWEVSDSAAPQIMDQMYGEIAAGRSPDAALRDAKLSMLKLQNVFRKPLYWATFQLYGGT
jgi:CHAT domain-containing protein